MYRFAAFTISFAAVYRISIATDASTMRRQTPKQNGGDRWYVDSSGDSHLVVPSFVGLEDHFQSAGPSHEKRNESSRQQFERTTVYAGEDGPWSGFHGFECGMYACGVKVRWETLQDRRRWSDDTGCNSLKLKYCHYDSWMRQSEWKGKENGHWGKKHDKLMCPQNYWITGNSVANSKVWKKKKLIRVGLFRTRWIKEPEERNC